MSGASWAVLAAFAVVAALNWTSRLRRGSRLEVATKPAATVLAAVLAALQGGATAATAVALVAFALCLAGDVLLLDQIDRFVAGLAAFLLGHVAFVAAFAVAGFGHPWWSAVAAVALTPLLATAGRGVFAGARRADPRLAGPVAAYLAVIATMALAAWATGRPAAMIGAAAFVTSDSLLGWGRFVRARAWTRVAVMVTYHLALGGLALAL